MPQEGTTPNERRSDEIPGSGGAPPSARRRAHGRRGRLPALGAVAVTAWLLLSPAPSGALEPVPGVAEVDGSDAEWTPADDVTALVGNDPPHVERGRLSLRYDCAEQVLFALLLAGPGLGLEAVDADETYLRFGSEAKLVSGTDGVDGEAPDAAWIDRSDGVARGIELSTPLAPGTYDDLRVHAKLPDDSEDEYETLDLSPRHQPLVITCAAAPAIAVADGHPSTSSGQVGPPDLARTGAPRLPVLATTGSILLLVGAALRMRRWRPAGR